MSFLRKWSWKNVIFCYYLCYSRLCCVAVTLLHTFLYFARPVLMMGKVSVSDGPGSSRFLLFSILFKTFGLI